MKWLFFCILPLFLFGSCIEIIDDLRINSDGSGTFRYTVNLSASKIRINSILALDSVDGRRVPDLEEIRAKINSIEQKLASKPGISNVKTGQDYNDYIFRLECDFKSVADLQNAVKEIIAEESKDTRMEYLDQDWISLSGNKLVRSIPEYSIDRKNNLKQEDVDLLKKGSYVCITRFDKIVDRTENEQANISANKMNVMVKTNIFALIENPSLLENTIYLSNSK